MRKHKGWIALDLDGTITDKTHRAPKDVVQFLHALQESGWEIIFITGRTFSFAWNVIKEFDFSYYLAIQNGADILLMPEKKRVERHYLDASAVPLLETAFEGEEEDFILYTGYEKGDYCYYRPNRFSPAFLEHIRTKIMPLSPEPWQSVESYDFEGGLSFPLAKCFGTKKAMERISALLHTVPSLSATMIRDPLADNTYLILVTAKLATKGNALNAIKKATGKGGLTIAAGDDLNDISMLEAADIKVVMSTAPAEMIPLATIVAKHGKQHGIIAALTEATHGR